MTSNWLIQIPLRGQPSPVAPSPPAVAAHVEDGARYQAIFRVSNGPKLLFLHKKQAAHEHARRKTQAFFS
jgi:hypothetical protein